MYRPGQPFVETCVESGFFLKTSLLQAIVTASRPAAAVHRPGAGLMPTPGESAVASAASLPLTYWSLHTTHRQPTSDCEDNAQDKPAFRPLSCLTHGTRASTSPSGFEPRPAPIGRRGSWRWQRRPMERPRPCRALNDPISRWPSRSRLVPQRRDAHSQRQTASLSEALCRWAPPHLRYPAGAALKRHAVRARRSASSSFLLVCLPSCCHYLWRATTF